MLQKTTVLVNYRRRNSDEKENTYSLSGTVGDLLSMLLLIPDDEDDLQEDLSSLTEKANIDSLRLSKFLQRATQVCSILLQHSCCSVCDQLRIKNVQY